MNNFNTNEALLLNRLLQSPASIIIVNICLFGETLVSVKDTNNMDGFYQGFLTENISK